MLFIPMKGVVIAPRERCLCVDGGVNFIPRKTIQKIDIHFPGPACKYTEIIVTLKGEGEQKCLNSETSFAKNLIKKAQKINGP
ncbi:C-X-C motif chemokine 11-1-like [Arapaima gigas]